MYVVFFFKQKTAYEMRISDWSSDVCSSDLRIELGALGKGARQVAMADEAYRKVAEGAVYKAVVEVNVGGDDVADRPVGGDSDGRAQRLALLTRRAGIHNGHALPASSAGRRVGKDCVVSGRSRW